MRHVRILGLALVAVFAITALAAASASAAEPEYKMCKKAAKVEKKYTGGYNDKRCTEVNVGGEGKYATSPVALPLSFEGKSKASTFYYSKPGGGGIVWEVVCKKDKDSATIEEPSYLEGTITFEKCAATNEVTKAKAVSCAGSIVVPFVGLLREETVPATPHPGITAMFLAPAYSCGGVSFESVTAYPFVTGEVSPTAKGEFGAWTVNKTTGVQSLEGWMEEGEPSKWAPVEAEVTEGAGTESLRFGLETTEALGPKKEVVIK